MPFQRYVTSDRNLKNQLFTPPPPHPAVVKADSAKEFP
jgi:hypothetical protein